LGEALSEYYCHTTFDDWKGALRSYVCHEAAIAITRFHLHKSEGQIQIHTTSPKVDIFTSAMSLPLIHVSAMMSWVLMGGFVGLSAMPLAE